MCGIFAYSGTKRDATQAVADGLNRLDYRGYDSWGVGILKNSTIQINKHTGPFNKKLLKLPPSSIAIGHTRWATNGAVTKTNAHPHWASDKSFILVHNGIIENSPTLKIGLQKSGYKFISQTDTEVIVHLIEEFNKRSKNLSEAVRIAFKKCTGRNTILLLANNGQIIAARNGSPLVIGVADNFSESYFSSDTLSFAPYVKKIIVLENGQMVNFENTNLSVLNVKDGKKVDFQLENNIQTDNKINKGKYNHFMLKEIYEEPEAIRKQIGKPDNIYTNFAEVIKKADSVYCIGSGTAGAAAFQIAYYLRTFANIPAIGLIGAEACDYYKLIGKNDLVIVPSQSGETADVLEVVEKFKKSGAIIASFVNMQGSMITRLSDYKFMAETGPEICVMSTKVFISQIAWGYLTAKAVQGKIAEGKRNLKKLTNQIEIFLNDPNKISQIRNLASQLHNSKDIFLLGKGQNLQIVKEGMVKIIESSYLHAHALSAGDLKHYVITLIEPGVPVILTISEDEVKNDMLISLNEVKARGAKTLVIGSKNDNVYDNFIQVPDTKETSAIMNTIPLQLLAYYMAVFLGNNVDKPRNIAKSVTVK